MKFALALALCVAALGQAPPKAVVVLRTSQLASRALEDVQSSVEPQGFACLLAHREVSAEQLKEARVLFLEHPEVEMLERLKPAAQQAARSGLRIASDTPEMVNRVWGLEVDGTLTQRLLPYFQNGGFANLRSFFLAVFEEAGARLKEAVPPVAEVARQGVYHPDAPHLFSNLSEFLGWYRPAHPQQGPLAVVSFFHSSLKNGDTAFLDALVRALEQQGLAAAGVFGWPLHTMEPVFQSPAADPVHVLLTFTLSLSKPEDRSFLQKLGVHVINLMVTRQSQQAWESAERGVVAARVATSLSNPESAGATDPIMVAATESDSSGLERTVAIPERVEMAARRARRWVELRKKPNHEKRLVILYYNNPPGKGNLGASYLNLPPSIGAVLRRLRQEGYLTGNAIPPDGQIISMLEKVGRNIETWAPGELTRMLGEGGVTLLPVEQYREWFNQLPKRFRDAVNGRWGKPEAAQLMVWRSDQGRLFFVIPGFRMGNIFLGPQLLRASFEEYTNVQHSATLPPHHGYVASYLYYRHRFKADAVIHMGRHGTLEWLPGKNAGQAGWDASEVLLGDLPNLNYYIMDGDGEAIQARRRAAAVDLSHLTPLIAQAGKQDRFAKLEQALVQWENTRETSPLVAAEYANVVRAELETTGLTKQLKLDLDHTEASFSRARKFLESVEQSPIPLGLPVLGRMPAPERQIAGLAAILESSFTQAENREIGPSSFRDWAEALVQGYLPDIPHSLPPWLREKAARVMEEGRVWLENLRRSPERELAVLIEALRGDYVPSGLVGDPLGVPAALPAGRNLHQGDPALIPTPAAWEVGKRLAKQLLEDHLRKHNRHLERISMVLWQGETGRHQGVMEAQALYLMGVEPEWNGRGTPDRLKLIPDAELGRPRVNVVFTVSGLYRDAYPDKILLLDRAARLAAAAGENALSRQNRETESALVAAGVDPNQAAAVAGARVFTTAPGAYGFGLQQVVEQSRDSQPGLMANLYLSKMNYVYSEQSWGVQVPKLLEHQLKGNEAILHSRSSNLYGAVDNDDTYQWMGGLRLASEAVGAKPELLINNLRRPGSEKIESAQKFLAAELNARNWNPQWIQEMQREGYSGARELGKAIEYLYGWQATAPEAIAPEVWKKTYDIYVSDEYKLGLKDFFDKANPAVRQNLVARLLEVDRQGAYRFSSSERHTLVREYVRLVTQHGIACSANVCANRRLRSEVLTLARSLPTNEMPSTQLRQFRRVFDEAMRPRPATSTESAPRRKRSFAGARPTLWKGMKVKIISMAEFNQQARRIIADNPPAVMAFAVAVLFGGLLVAAGKRRVQPFAAIHLYEPTPAQGETQSDPVSGL